MNRMALDLSAGVLFGKFLTWLKDKLVKDDHKIKIELHIGHAENCSFITIGPTESDQMGDLIAAGQYGLTRKKLAPFNAALMSEEGRSPLVALKPYLSNKEYVALRVSYSIIDQENQQRTSSVPEIVGLRVIDMKDSLKKCHPEYGPRFYNLAVTGAFEYLAGVIPGLIQSTPNPDDHYETVRGVLDLMLGYNKSMVFTSPIMSPKDIRNKITPRLRDYSLDSILVFARGVMVDIVDHICVGMASEYGQEFLLTQNHYQLGMSIASANVFTRKQEPHA